GRIRRELVAAPVVELLHRADQAQRALLDQIQERQATAEIALGDGADQPQVGLPHLLLGHQVAALDALGQRHLALGGQQLYAGDRAQVEPERIQAGLDREGDLRLARAVGVLGTSTRRLKAPGLGYGRLAVGVDDVNAFA